VKINGKTVHESPLLHGLEGPWNIDVPIPKDAERIALVTSDAGDGNANEPCAWAQAGFVCRVGLALRPLASGFTDDIRVRIESQFRGGEMPPVIVRYTTDGGPVAPDSPAYAEPLKVTDTTTVKARAFLRGTDRALSAETEQTFSRVEPGLRYCLIRAKVANIPLFGRDKCDDRGVADAIDIAEMPEEPFAVQFSGFLKIERGGEYTFFCASDDGSRLWIDDRCVVDHDGCHARTEARGTVRLHPGFHEMVVEYFDAGGARSLDVMYEGPGLERRSIPANRLFRASKELRPS
jgi:hypothetical protein